MDSLSQLALGSALSVAAMGRRTAVGKAALWGGVAGTLPDLDVLIDYGDPILNMVLHRGHSHALLWLTLLALPLGAAIAKLHGEWACWQRWCWAMGLALVTHPLLDTMTVYGTQIFQPFSNHPFGVGSIFIIDPLYTLPLLVGAIWALVASDKTRGLRANLVGLVLSCIYLLWTVVTQQHVSDIAQASLKQQGIAAQRTLVTPSPFNSVLWRVVAVDDKHFYEGFYSLLDTTREMQWDRFDRGLQWSAALKDVDGVRRIQSFSHGFYKLSHEENQLRISDLRMGQEPGYVFSFAVATLTDPSQAPQVLQPSQAVGGCMDPQRGLAWLKRRIIGERLPPPR
ncbi:MAG: metal-dependent hydrolase [Burkholderiales bacterium]